MQTENYRNWLEDQGYQDRTIDTKISQAKRIEKYYGDLDELYKKDRLESLILELNYTAEDRSYGRPNETRIPIEGDIYNSLASYKAAARLYKKFLKNESEVSVFEPKMTEEVDVEPAPKQAIGLQRNRVNLQALTEQMKNNKLQLLSILNSFQAISKRCRKIYCTTCGGLVRAIESDITLETSNEINTILSRLSVEEFVSLGEWIGYLRYHYPASVCSMCEGELRSLDATNIRQLDYYLYYLGGVMNGSHIYDVLFKQGIQMAIDTSDDSLIETIAIILGSSILGHDKLYKLALDKCKTNKQIHRVLYNNLREKIPQVRDFVGDGTTIACW